MEVGDTVPLPDEEPDEDKEGYKVAHDLNELSSVYSSNDKLTGLQMYESLLPLTKKVVSLFEDKVNSCLQLLTENVVTDFHKIQHHCQLLQRNVVSLTGVANILKTFFQSSRKFLLSLYLYLETSFKTLQYVLKLCKEVELNHTQHFQEIANYLGPLFKTSFTLLKLSADCVEYIKPSEIVEEDISSINRVICSLFNTAQISLHFDPSLILLTWKAVGKLVCRLREHTHSLSDNEWSLSSVVCGICDAMKQKSQECVKCASQKDKDGQMMFSKLLKTCRFFSTLLLKVIQEYESYQHDLAETILIFLLELTSSLPPSPSCEISMCKPKLAEIEANITIVLEPVFTALMNCEIFLQHLTSTSNITTSNSYAWCTMLCTLLKYFHNLEERNRLYLLEETSSQCVSAVSCRLVDTIFECVKYCHVEFNLPVYILGVSYGGQPSYEVTLYENICTHFCSILACLSAEHYNILEVVLFRNLFNDDIYCSLLAQDIFSFLARWGPSELCYKHVNLLTQLIITLPNTNSHHTLHIQLLLNRLIAFLTPTQQREFIQHHPSSSLQNLKLWSSITFSSFDIALQEEVCRGLLELCLYQLKKDKNDAIIISYCLQCLKDILSKPGLKSHITQVPTELVDQLLKILNGALVAQRNGWKSVIHVLITSELLQTVSLLLHQLYKQQLLMVLSISCALVKNSPTAVLVGVANILSQCGTLKSHDLLKPITICFSLILSHTHSWLSQHYSLDAFRQFAEITPHANILEECIPPAMNNIVVDYLQKVPYKAKQHPELLETRHILSLLKAQQHELTNRQKDVILSNQSSPSVIVDESYTVVLTDLLQSWESIKCLNTPLSSEGMEKLRSLWQQIGQYLNEQ